jgi:hypothetical protein
MACVVIDRPQGLHSNVCNSDRSPICSTVRANLKGSLQLGHPASQSVQILSTRRTLSGAVDGSITKFRVFAVDIDQPGKGRLITATRKEKVRVWVIAAKKEAPKPWGLGAKGTVGRGHAHVRPHLDYARPVEPSKCVASIAAGTAPNPFKAVWTFRARSSDRRYTPKSDRLLRCREVTQWARSDISRRSK